MNRFKIFSILHVEFDRGTMTNTETGERFPSPDDFGINLGCGDYRSNRPEDYLKCDIVGAHGHEMLLDIENLPFKTNSIHRIWMTHVINHLNNPQKALDEIYRVLTKESGFEGFLTISPCTCETVHNGNYDEWNGTFQVKGDEDYEL